MSDERRPAGDEEGGDPVCWAHLLCPECGAVPDEPGLPACPRCGAPWPQTDPEIDAPD